jgi:hypothetical protein
MFAITCRSMAERESSPGPWYSMIRPTPPLTPCRRSISRITSFALTHGGSAPVSRTPQICGIVTYSGSPAIAIATSRPPTPMASMPSEPAAHVCESDPASDAPGRPNRSMCTGCETPLPGREYQTPNRWQADLRNR